MFGGHVRRERASVGAPPPLLYIETLAQDPFSSLVEDAAERGTVARDAVVANVLVMGWDARRVASLLCYSPAGPTGGAARRRRRVLTGRTTGTTRRLRPPRPRPRPEVEAEDPVVRGGAVLALAPSRTDRGTLARESRARAPRPTDGPGPPAPLVLADVGREDVSPGSAWRGGPAGRTPPPHQRLNRATALLRWPYARAPAQA